MDIILQDLKKCNSTCDFQHLSRSLQKILSEPENLQLATADSFELLLDNKNHDVLLLSLQCIAELAKQENNRNVFTNEKIINRLINLETNGDKVIFYHCCRALGNVCYENDEARNILGIEGLQKFICKIKAIGKTWCSKDDPQLMTVLYGCLLNILTSNDVFQKTALNSNMLESITIVLNKAIEYFSDQEDCITYILQILSFISDHMIDQWISDELCTLLVHVIRISENAEVSVLCLEILRQQSENDDHKLLLAKLGTCELVYDLVQKYGSEVDDEDSRSALKLACDLIVLILTGDEAMKLLYDNSDGKVYHQMTSWIDSNDPDLMSTGILAIGNFARNDAHCIYMVKSGLSRKLLDILVKHNKTDFDVKIQHAILSCLRHLSIPAKNKTLLINENIIDVLYGMINISYLPVIFKLMGTFRMLVDGQVSTACILIRRKEFIEKIVYWCYNSDHLGVRAEAPRLLAWLVKNSQSTDAFCTLISVQDSIKCLIEMISSLHAVMQNEAISALNLICSRHFQNNSSDKHLTVSEQVGKMNIGNAEDCVDSAYVAEVLIKADIGKNISFLINKYYEKMSFDTINNLVKLLLILTKSERIVDNFKSANIIDVICLLQKNKNAKNICDEMNLVVSKFKSE